MRTWTWIALLAAASPLAVPPVEPSRAPQSRPALETRIDALLGPVADRRYFSGVVEVHRRGERVARRLYGRTNFELDAPMAAEARFRIASITKTFTGALIAVMAEQGTLKLTDPVAKFLPAFPKGDVITLRHLLLHASGVPNPDSPSCSAATLDDIVAELARKPLWFEPGARSGYSNGGYALLAKVAEVAGGASWDVLLDRLLFAPAGLSSVVRDIEARVIPMRAGAYVAGPLPAGVMNASCASAQAAFGGGALLSTAGDLATWARAAGRDAIFKLSALEYPYGWGRRKYFDRDAIEQSGIMNGTASYLLYFPADDVTVVILSNVQSGMLTEAGLGVAALALDLEPAASMMMPPAPVRMPEAHAAWLGTWGLADFGEFRLLERDGALFQAWGSAGAPGFVALSDATHGFNANDWTSLELAGNDVIVRWSDGTARRFAKR